MKIDIIKVQIISKHSKAKWQVCKCVHINTSTKGQRGLNISESTKTFYFITWNNMIKHKGKCIQHYHLQILKRTDNNVMLLYAWQKKGSAISVLVWHCRTINYSDLRFNISDGLKWDFFPQLKNEHSACNKCPNQCWWTAPPALWWWEIKAFPWQTCLLFNQTSFITEEAV